MYGTVAGTSSHHPSQQQAAWDMAHGRCWSGTWHSVVSAGWHGQLWMLMQQNQGPDYPSSVVQEPNGTNAGANTARLVFRSDLQLQQQQPPQQRVMDVTMQPPKSSGAGPGSYRLPVTFKGRGADGIDLTFVITAQHRDGYQAGTYRTTGRGSVPADTGTFELRQAKCAELATAAPVTMPTTAPLLSKPRHGPRCVVM